MVLGSIACEFHISNAQLSQCRPVCEAIQSQTPIVCISSTRQPCLDSRSSFSELESTSCICISSYNSDTFCSSQDMSISVQNSSHCSLLASIAVVLGGPTTINVSSSTSSIISKTSDTIKRKISTSKSSIIRPLCLGVIKQSIRDKKFLLNVAGFVSKSRRTSTKKVYDAKWVVYIN